METRAAPRTARAPRRSRPGEPPPSPLPLAALAMGKGWDGIPRCPHHLTSRGSLGRVDDEPLTCAECGREAREDENAADERRAYRDISGELPVFCTECAEREIGADA
jgi:hypothetical protein